MESNKFLMLNEQFLKDKDIRNLPKSIFHILIDLLFLSFEWHHKPFFRTPEQLYQYLNINKMTLNRAFTKLSTLGINIEYRNKRYYFDLTGLFEGLAPFSNKNVTVNKLDVGNKIVTDNESSNKIDFVQ